MSASASAAAAGSGGCSGPPGLEQRPQPPAAYPYPYRYDSTALHNAVCIVTGANGYFGRRLASALLQHTACRRVVLFDVVAPLRDPSPPVRPATLASAARVVKVAGDIRDAALVDRMFDLALDADADADAVPDTGADASDAKGNSKSNSKAARACDLVVFHVASYGMSGREQVADPHKVMGINVTGTEHIINACERAATGSTSAGAGAGAGAQQRPARRVALVYTSTYNVVFGGDPAQPLVNGDEFTPYLPLHVHCDLYSRTKAMAEQLVLRANGSGMSQSSGKSGGGGGGVQTTALRSAGIYGEGEERHLPRIVSLMHAGLFAFTIGSGKAGDGVVEFVYVDNLVHAHVLAALSILRDFDTNTSARHPEQNNMLHLLSSPASSTAAAAATTTAASATAAAAAPRAPRPAASAAGRAYFISDGEPCNNFEFFRPLAEGLGFGFPTLRLPYGLAFRMAHAIELVHRAVATRVYNFQPLLSRAEVNKVAVTHWFDPTAARRDLGYVPCVDTREGMRRAVEHFQVRGLARRPWSRATVLRLLLWLVLAVVAVACVLRLWRRA